MILNVDYICMCENENKNDGIFDIVWHWQDEKISKLWKKSSDIKLYF